MVKRNNPLRFIIANRDQQVVGRDQNTAGKTPSAPAHQVRAVLQFSLESFEIVIEARLVLAAMLLCVLVLAILGVIAAYVLYVLEYIQVSILAHMFLLNSEANLPTLFSFSMLILCSLLLAMIFVQQSRLGARWRLYWAILAGLFFVMSFDEAASVHERLILPVREALNATGWLFFAWVIPAWAFVAVLSLAYLRFLLALPKPFTRLFVLSSALYIAGALGVEMSEGAYAEVHGTGTFTFQVIATIEETLEMAGLAVFVHTLVRFLARQQEPLSLRFRAR